MCLCHHYLYSHWFTPWMQSSNVMFNCFECNARIALASSRISQGFLDWETRYLGLSTPLYSADTFPNFHITIQYVLLGLEGKGKFFLPTAKFKLSKFCHWNFVVSSYITMCTLMGGLLRNDAGKKSRKLFLHSVLLVQVRLWNLS